MLGKSTLAPVAAGLLWAGAASAATLPTGAWSCYRGPSWSQFGARGPATAFTPQAPQAQLWILDQRRYAMGDRQDGGVYALRGDEIVGASGPFQRVPMSIHYAAAGLGGRPTVFLSWATAPSIAIVCQPAA